MSESEKNKRIAQNTFFLYIRMFIMMGVSLYTSRVILQTLGVEDFGLYNVVAGIVILFSFVNNAMSIASQRFISFALGENKHSEVTKVFSMSLSSHFVISLVVFFLAETIGQYILSKMNIPESRIVAANWTYQFAIFTCLVQIMRVPYNALIIAYERMSFYAWISVIEVVLRLSIVYLLIAYEGDRLIFYSVLLFGVTVLVNFVYTIFCIKKFHTCRYHFFWDSHIFKEFISFSGWSMAGSLANISATQGLNMIINIFCGVTVNAAVGISNQVMGAVYQFLSNFQTAFNPQLVKSYASGEKDYFMKLIFKTSKFSYYLMFVISLPAIVCCEFYLNVWLGIVPEYAVQFTQLMIMFLLIDAIGGPLWISVQATGKIKRYQLLMASLILLNLPIAYLVLFLGYSPIYVFVGRLLINIITLVARMLYLKPLINLPLKDFIIQVIWPITLTSIVVIPLVSLKFPLFNGGWLPVLLESLYCILLSSICIYFLGINREERAFVKQIIKTKILKNG